MFYFKHNRLEDGRFTLTRALQSLDKREVVETSVKFAQIEFKYGDSERGRTSRDGPDILIFFTTGTGFTVIEKAGCQAKYAARSSQTAAKNLRLLENANVQSLFVLCFDEQNVNL